MIPKGVGRKKDHRSSKWVWALLLIVLGNAAHSVSHFYSSSPALIISDIQTADRNDGGQAQSVSNSYHHCTACESFQYAPSQAHAYIIGALPSSEVVFFRKTLPFVAEVFYNSGSERGPPRS